MPTSKREAILANVLTVLAAINGGPTYNTTPKKVDREFQPVESRPATDFPILYVTAGGERKDGTTPKEMQAHMTLEVRGFMKREGGPSTGGKTLSQSLNELLFDVETALGLDETRGGNAEETLPLQVEADEISLDELAGFLFTFDVIYSYLRGAP